MAQKRSNVGLYLGVAAAGGVGYYLYTAGGNPKVAEKQFEGSCSALELYVHILMSAADVSKASAKVKSEVPGRTNQAQKEGEKWASEAGAKVDSAVSILFYRPSTAWASVCDLDLTD